MPIASSPDEARAQAAKAEAARVAAAAKSAADVNDLMKRFGPNGDISVETDNYGRFVLVQNKAGKTVPVFFIVDSNGKDWDIFTESQIVKKYKADAAKGAGLEALRKKLYEIGLISQKEYTSQDEAAFNNGIISAANNHSMEQVQKYTLNPGQNAYTFTPFSSWLSGKKSGLTPSASTPPIDTDIQKTDRVNTDQDIDVFILDMLGRNATQQEKNEYYKMVANEQAAAKRKATVKGTTQTTTGEFLDEEDYFRIASEVIKPSLIGSLPQDITKLGGKIGKQMVDLRTYAADYGVRIDGKQALDYVLGGLAPGGSLDTGSLDTQKSTIREMSKAFYTNLAPLIDNGVKISDIGRQFAAYKGRILEMPDEAVDIFDEDIQQALRNDGKTGVMSLTDYEIALRNNPKTKDIWAKTRGAREEASSYADNILKTFGLVGQ